MASLLTNNNNNNNDDESKGGDDDSNDIEFLREHTDSQEIEIQATGKRGEITKKEILHAINNSNNNKHNAGDGKNNNEVNIVDRSPSKGLLGVPILKCVLKASARSLFRFPIISFSDHR